MNSIAHYTRKSEFEVLSFVAIQVGSASCFISGESYIHYFEVNHCYMVVLFRYPLNGYIATQCLFNRPRKQTFKYSVLKYIKHFWRKKNIMGRLRLTARLPFNVVNKSFIPQQSHHRRHALDTYFRQGVLQYQQGNCPTL